jgi:hypothetical protein
VQEACKLARSEHLREIVHVLLSAASARIACRYRRSLSDC